jgi:endoplasmic reticulum chaperone BiP
MTILWTILCLTIPLAMAKAHEQSEHSPVVGIDLGTTYSCVGIYQNGKVDIIPNEQGNRITPSYVAFSESEKSILVGDAAKNQATVNPTNTVFDIKRLIGRDFSDKSVQADRKLVPFQILSKGNKPVVQVNAAGSTNTYTPEEISAMILSNMKTTAEQFLGVPVTRAVITVPAYFNQAQRMATEDAATIAGLKVDRIINEPTAAAMAYGIDKTMDDASVLVFDLGGGTFDVTLLNIDGGVFDVLATSGDTHLGGEDFDQRVMQYFIKKIQNTHGTDISNEKVAIQKLRKEVERVKRALSTQTQARIEIDDLVPGLTFTDTLTRARFEELNNDLFKKTLKPIEMVLKDAKLDKSDVEHIVLVGGSTRIPRIQEMVSEFFGGKELSKGINPDEAVAYGAAILGGIFSGEAKKDLDQVVLLDVASLSQGIETVGGIMTKMIDRGTTIPTRKTRE